MLFMYESMIQVLTSAMTPKFFILPEFALLAYQHLLFFFFFLPLLFM